MAVKLHRCGNMWIKLNRHPCWKVQKALDANRIEYEVVKGPNSRGKRTDLIEHIGQDRFPAIELEDGTWYRESSDEMVARIDKGELLQTER